MVQEGAGIAFAVSSVACGWGLTIDPRRRWPAATGAVALAAAAAVAFAGAETVPAEVPLAAAIVMLVTVVLARFDGVPVLSWLDAVIVGSASAALVAVFERGSLAVLACAGALGGLALSRWQPTPSMLLAAAGVLALGAGSEPPALAAAVLLPLAALRREGIGDRGPEFRWTVMAAIVLSATVALAILAVNQFAMHSATAGLLAIVTFLVGIGRAGVTVTSRIRESDRRARCDELTGLGNRRSLVDRLDALMTDRQEHALLLIDLDGFKELNDTLGHHAGDEVLRQIGPRLAHAVRDHDTLARLGGDEFALVIAPGDEAGGGAAALRLRNGLEAPFDVEGITVHINASVGIALFPAHAQTALGLLQRADVAMYEAKRKRTGLEVYLASRDVHSRERLALVGEMRSAIEAGELVLHYQPKASLDTGRVHGVEALVRWNHPWRGLLEPEAFLPIAEQSGLTRALTAFVLGKAIQQAGEWERAGLDLNVAVNLGPADLLDLGLPDEVSRLLERGDCPPGRMQLEVSEDVVMADPDRTIDVLRRLRDLGVRIALDDFGAGHSSLSHLTQLHLDELKIDRSFVQRMDRSQPHGAIVRSSIDLGRRLHLRVVAEGVESAETWDTLAAWGCQEAQGFYLARPMPAGEVRGWLDAANRAGADGRPVGSSR